MSDKKTLVAVYGTLRQGNGNHRLISRSSSAEFLGTGKVQEPATMFTNGGFPYLSFLTELDPETLPTVEVYAVDDACLKDLDRLEGYPGWYSRKAVEVFLPDYGQFGEGSTVSALIYHQDRDFREDGLRIIESGDWMEDRRRA